MKRGWQSVAIDVAVDTYLFATVLGGATVLLLLALGYKL